MRRFARREHITDAILAEAIKRAERGIIDADLGGGLISNVSLGLVKGDPADFV